MSLLLLDTTFLIDAERGGVDLDDAIDDDDDVAIAAVTAAELLQAYIDEIIGSLPIIAYDRDVAVEHAVLLVAVHDQSRPRSAHDLLIAATARTTDRKVVAADQEAFADLLGVATLGHR